MIQATINGKTVFDVEKDLLNNQPFEWDILPIGNDSFHSIKENISYTATLLAINKDEKTMLLRINNTEYEIAIKDKYCLLSTSNCV